MSEANDNLTGVWNGRYDYQHDIDPVGFMATIIDSGASLSGGVSETCADDEGIVVDLFAMLSGRRSGSTVAFTKTYDESSGWSHSVDYDGRLSADGNEIEGEWRIPGKAHGRFLMVRPERKTAEVEQKVEAKV
jgi:hypothetical protein